MLVGRSLFAFFLTWWGAFLLGALDSSMLFFLPFGIDALVIYLVARNEQLFWVYPILAAAGSVVGAAVTFWIGKKVGDVGVERFIPRRRVERIRRMVSDRGAIAMALPALLPPPFPLTPFVLCCGALNVNHWKFFGTFGMVRLCRFGVEAGLARVYGRRVLQVLESDTFQMVVAGFIIVAVIGTLVSAAMMWRGVRGARLRPA